MREGEEEESQEIEEETECFSLMAWDGIVVLGDGVFCLWRLAIRQWRQKQAVWVTVVVRCSQWIRCHRVAMTD
jgi:hypothetical protein